MRGLCFEHPAWALPGTAAWPEMDSHRLAPAQRQDLAEVLPYLGCGEVSAVLAFSGRLLRRLPLSARQGLRAMAHDEQRHALLIEQLQKTLPAPRLALDGPRIALFFQRLESEDAALHLAHIAALDRAVCQLLQPLLRRGAALSAAPAVHRALCALRQDEARHVRMARLLAQQCGAPAALQQRLDHDIRVRLQAILQPVHVTLARLAAPLDVPHQAAAA